MPGAGTVGAADGTIPNVCSTLRTTLSSRQTVFLSTFTVISFVFPKRLHEAIGATFQGCDTRKFRLAAVGERRDGAVVVSCNGGVRGCKVQVAHAEYRLARKLDYGSVVYVARTLKNGQVALARPCSRCLKALSLRNVSRIYYTISDVEYGVIDLE